MSIKYFNLEKWSRAKALGGSEADILANYIRFGGAYEGTLEPIVDSVPAPKPPKPSKKGRSKKK